MNILIKYNYFKNNLGLNSVLLNKNIFSGINVNASFPANILYYNATSSNSRIFNNFKLTTPTRFYADIKPIDENDGKKVPATAGNYFPFYKPDIPSQTVTYSPIPAMDLVSDFVPIEIHGHRVWCDGIGSGGGHPREHIAVVKNKITVCMYCGLRYTQAKHFHADH